ncbi:MAG: diphthine--ammonia ligase [Nanoarchaeota archaeon]|nr:diphthine--ammonia ligase [Nanoarchaeota archaeon]
MVKKLASLFSGGKDSVYATYMAKNEGYDIACLVSIFSENLESYMFHTPSVEKTKKQAEVMGVPLLIQGTKGEKEIELEDLKIAIQKAKDEYGIEGVISGAIQSVYQASRVQKICDELDLEVFNPLWQKDESEYLDELLKEKFKVIIVGVFAYPFDSSWLLREIDKKFISEIRDLNKKYEIHVAGEGGEFETFVVGCPLYSRELKVVDSKISIEGEYSYRLEIELV